MCIDAEGILRGKKINLLYNISMILSVLNWKMWIWLSKTGKNSLEGNSGFLMEQWQIEYICKYLLIKQCKALIAILNHTRVLS